MAFGLHSDVWLDLDVLLSRPCALRPHITSLALRLSEFRPDVICGPLLGGAFIAQMLADELDAAFCYAEKPPDRDEFAIAAAFPAMLSGKRVAIVDDAIQAGSA